MKKLRIPSGLGSHAWRGRLLALLAALGLIGRLPAAPVSYEAAIQFGWELQNVFPKERAAALVSRLDGDGMRRRTFGPLGEDTVQSPQVVKLWQESLLPGIVAELDGLKSFPVLQFHRVMLLDNWRVLECVMFNERQEFSVVLIWLGLNSEGRVAIHDMRFIATHLETSRRLRQTFLLLGVPASASLDAEESDLAYQALGVAAEVRMMFQALGAKDWDQAFRYWNGLPARLKNTRIWHDLRDTLAVRGSKAAQENQRQQYYAGSLSNTFDRFLLARNLGNLAEAAVELDALIQQNHAQPFLRVVRAEIAAQLGRNDEALAISREVYEYYPFMNGAYLMALRAALASGRAAELPDILSRWALLVKPEEMDRQLQLAPELAAVAATPEYKTWREGVASSARN